MTIHAIVGAQFGSEAKGHVAAQLTARLMKQPNAVMLVRVGGSNAGHSAVAQDGTVWALRHIPAAAVIDRDARLIIAQGSEVDFDVLFDECDRLDAAGFNVSERLCIDPYATVVDETHYAAEKQADLTARVGSTGKGVGAARAARLMRKAEIIRDYSSMLSDRGIAVIETAEMIHYWHEQGTNIIIEGTQGYGLGLCTEFYPQTTSGNCRTVDLLAQIGYTPLNPNCDRTVYTWLVMRTYPIRVAGNSGPLMGETDWDTLSDSTDGYIQTERTTVTKKVRRVGAWDPSLVRAAVHANGGNGAHLAPCLMFADYIEPRAAGATTTDSEGYAALEPLLDGYEQAVGQPIAMLGTGQSTAIWRDNIGSAAVAATLS